MPETDRPGVLVTELPVINAVVLVVVFVATGFLGGARRARDRRGK